MANNQPVTLLVAYGIGFANLGSRIQCAGVQCPKDLEDLLPADDQMHDDLNLI